MLKLIWYEGQEQKLREDVVLTVCLLVTHRETVVIT